jgi:4-hydroxyphenylpyruvate dioxygenase
MSEPVPLRSIHHVEFVVGNAKQAAYFYRKAFGFSQVAYLGPETGHRDRASYALRQNDIRLVLTTPLAPEHPLSEHLKLHGDGVRDIAFQVDDADAVYHEVLKRGALPAVEPRSLEDSGGHVRHAAVRTYGDTIHSFYSLAEYDGPFLPGFRPEERREPGVGLMCIDHIVGNVEDHRMDTWVDWYVNTFGFHQFVSFDDKDISTEFTALRSKVVASPSRRIKFPINEPAEGLKKSQIQEYVEFYRGAGAQHLALHTGDIVESVAKLRERGLDFLHVPDTYYETIWDRVGAIDERHEDVQAQNILVDRDDTGYLLQLFTQPVEDRPTLFFEVIQRHGAQSFGKGNFKALFEAIEREQAKRGNL